MQGRFPMTIAQYSRLKGCSRQAVLQRIARGTLEAVKIENPFVRGGWHWDIVDKPSLKAPQRLTDER